MKQLEQRVGWLWYATAQWLLGVGFGVAVCAKWPSVPQNYVSWWLPIGLGYVLIHTVGKKRNGEVES